jgi:hypothetical protein
MAPALSVYFSSGRMGANYCADDARVAASPPIYSGDEVTHWPFGGAIRREFDAFNSPARVSGARPLKARCQP